MPDGTILSPREAAKLKTARRYVAMLDSGMTRNDIAGVEGSSLEHVCKLIGLIIPRKKRAPNWTEDRESELRRRWNAGESLRSISDAMGVSEGSVSGKVHEMRLPFRRLTNGEHQVITTVPSGMSPRAAVRLQLAQRYARMKEQGMSAAQIALSEGRDPKWVCEMIGLITPPKKRSEICWSESDKAEVVRRRSAGESDAQIAKAVGRTEGGVRWQAYCMGLPPRRRKTWPASYESHLKAVWDSKSPAEIGRDLGYSRSAVIGKARRMGLSQRGRKSANRQEN